ncbi:MAG TPA: glucosamine-6-phosphate deaminase [Actinomycetota bacterium]
MGGPRTVVVENADELTRAAADVVSDVIVGKPEASVVAATGRTPMGLYAELAARHEKGLRTAGITAFQLDEYLGLGPTDRRSLFGWMRQSFLEPLGIHDERAVRLPTEGDVEGSCEEFDAAIRARGGLDLAILGLGPNGHLGFNEPPSGPDDPTRIVTLSPATVEANARYWGDIADVPTDAVTMGLQQLLAVRTIVLIASGRGKRDIVHAALEGPVAPEVPASFLQVTAAEVTAFVDRDAWGEA